MPLKVTKRKDSPYYQIVGTIKGHGRVRESAKLKSKAEADELAHDIERDIKAGLKRKNVKTLSDAITEYLENGGDNRYTYRINEALGKTPLDKINQEAIDKGARIAFAGYKRGSGAMRTYKPSTIKREFYVPLAAILHYAYRLDWMPYIPVETPKTERPAPKWADETWLSKFSDHAPHDLMNLVKFLTGTGCRISEALNLEPKDVLLKTGEAYVRTTKTGNPRMAHLPSFVMEAIRPYVKENKARVFHMFNSRYVVNHALEKACKAAKIQYLSSHQVGSHTFATNLARLEGMDAKALTATGRWKSPQSTYHYTHYLKTEQASKADSLEKLFRK